MTEQDRHSPDYAQAGHAATNERSTRRSNRGQRAWYARSGSLEAIANAWRLKQLQMQAQGSAPQFPGS